MTQRPRLPVSEARRFEQLATALSELRSSPAFEYLARGSNDPGVPLFCRFLERLVASCLIAHPDLGSIALQLDQLIAMLPRPLDLFRHALERARVAFLTSTFSSNS